MIAGLRLAKGQSRERTIKAGNREGLRKRLFMPLVFLAALPTSASAASYVGQFTGHVTAGSVHPVRSQYADIPIESLIGHRATISFEIDEYFDYDYYGADLIPRYVVSQVQVSIDPGALNNHPVFKQGISWESHYAHNSGTYEGNADSGHYDAFGFGYDTGYTSSLNLSWLKLSGSVFQGSAVWYSEELYVEYPAYLYAQIALERGYFTAVPEPSTWALLLIGFGSTGLGLRRRKIASSQPLLSHA